MRKARKTSESLLQMLQHCVKDRKHTYLCDKCSNYLAHDRCWSSTIARNDASEARPQDGRMELDAGPDVKSSASRVCLAVVRSSNRAAGVYSMKQEIDGVPWLLIGRPQFDAFVSGLPCVIRCRKTRCCARQSSFLPYNRGGGDECCLRSGHHDSYKVLFHEFAAAKVMTIHHPACDCPSAEHREQR